MTNVDPGDTFRDIANEGVVEIESVTDETVTYTATGHNAGRFEEDLDSFIHWIDTGVLMEVDDGD